MPGRNGHPVAFVLLIVWSAALAVLLVALLGHTPSVVAADIASGGPRTALAPSADPIEIVVAKGDSADHITQVLVHSGVLADSAAFSALLAFTGNGGLLQAGRYELPAHTPATEVLRRLRLGLASQLVVTVPEGLRLEEIGAIFAARGAFTKEQWDEALQKNYGEPFVGGGSLTGYLLPAGYPVSKHATAEEIVKAMLDNFVEQVTPQLIGEAQAKGLTRYQVLTLASIVEREAAVSRDQPLVASVLLNRLSAGMALQADPTVQYAIATPASVARYGWWKRELSNDDLQVDSPYNTYTRPGLPPGPIANPGIAAIRAVIRAPKTSFLFFVAAPQCDGSHRFAVTLAEHQTNVNAYHAARCGQ